MTCKLQIFPDLQEDCVCMLMGKHMKLDLRADFLKNRKDLKTGKGRKEGKEKLPGVHH